MNIYSFARSMDIWNLANSVNTNLSRLCGAVVRVLSFRSTSWPQPGFQFCYLCALLWIFALGWLVCLFPLTLFLSLCFSWCLSFPTFGLSFLHRLSEPHPSFKGKRSDVNWILCGPSTFNYLNIYAPHSEWFISPILLVRKVQKCY